MKVDIQHISSSKKALRIEIPPEDVNKEFEEVYEEVRRNLEIPGFRKGRAPRSVLRMRFGEYAKNEVLEKLIKPAYEKAVKDANLIVMGPPDISAPADSAMFSVGVELQPALDGGDIPPDLRREFEKNGVPLSDRANVSVEETASEWLITDNRKRYRIKKKDDRLNVYSCEISVKEDEPLIFSATVDVKPEIIIPELSQLEVDKGDVNVTREDVDRFLEQLREENADLVPIEDRPVQEGDYVTLDIKFILDGEVLEDKKEQVFEVREGALIPGMVQNLVGMRPGDENDFSLTFPEDYQPKALAGKEARVHVVLHRIAEKHLPPIDDEFAKDRGEEDLQHLVAKTWNQLVEMRKLEQREKQKEDLLRQLLERSQFEVPNYLLESQISALTKGRTDISSEELSQYRSLALTMIRKAWIFEEIAKREGISVSDEEISARVAELASAKNRDPQKYMSQLKVTKRLDNIIEELLEEKIFSLLIERASPRGVLIR